jgi:hypothetical protein
MGFIRLGDEMADVEPIPKELLQAIRELNDASLTRLIKEISEYGWVKAAETLKLALQERKEWI